MVTVCYCVVQSEDEIISFFYFFSLVRPYEWAGAASAREGGDDVESRATKSSGSQADVCAVHQASKLVELYVVCYPGLPFEEKKLTQKIINRQE